MRLLLAAWLATAAVAAPGGLEVKVKRGLGGVGWTHDCPVVVDVSVAAGHVQGDLALITRTSAGPLRQVMRLDVDGPARQRFRLVEPLSVVGVRPVVELDGERLPLPDDSPREE